MEQQLNSSPPGPGDDRCRARERNHSLPLLAEVEKCNLDILKIPISSYHPEFMDLCTEFADSEEFLIDGDALLRQVYLMCTNSD